MLMLIPSGPGSLLETILECYRSLPADQMFTLAQFEELETIYHAAAMQGNTAVPENAQDEVDFHYVCFAKDGNSNLQILDGDRKGPVNTGVLLGAESDLLSEASIHVVKEFMKRGGNNSQCSLMALVRK